MTLVNARALLKRAEKKGVGCGAFNMGNMEMVRGAVKAAEESNVPIILQLAEGRMGHFPLELMGPMMVQAAKEASVDIAVHLDHGKTIDVIRKALNFGFTSIMFDGSAMPFEDNISRTREIVRLASNYDACVEGELGIVGGSEDGTECMGIKCTDPSEAVIFCEKTGIDSLAVAIGNAHGNYPAAPILEFGVLEEIWKRTTMPLVLHGGSGIKDADLQKAIRLGMRKLNIATSNFNALMEDTQKYIERAVLPDFFGLNEVMTDSIYRNVKKHIEVFNRATN